MGDEEQTRLVQLMAKASQAIRKHDVLQLRDASRDAINEASISQDANSLSLAVIIYSIVKIMERGNSDVGKSAILLEHAQAHFQKGKELAYKNELKKLFGFISDADKRLKFFINEVIAETRIKKGGGLYEHGISVGQAASLLDVSMWDLMNYVGKIRASNIYVGGISPKKRMETARSLFTAIPAKKSLVFDAGPVISLTTNNLLRIVAQLKARFDGEFILPESVRQELVDRPLEIKRFEFEALQVQQEIGCKNLTVLPDAKTREAAERLLSLANSLLIVRGKRLKIVHYGEMSTIAAAKMYNARVVVIDERTTRDLIENPESLAAHIKDKLQAKVRVDDAVLKELKAELKGLQVIRSAELVAVAFELGLLDTYVNKCAVPDANVRKVLLDSVLWGVKLHGCAISKEEILQILKGEKF